MLTQNENLKYNSADLQAAESEHFKKLALDARNLKEHNFYKKDKVIPGEVKKISACSRRVLCELGYSVEIFAGSECFKNEHDPS